jgi:hypothetical protein
MLRISRGLKGLVENQKPKGPSSNSADRWNVLRGMSKELAKIYRQRAAECEALARHYEAMPLAKYFRELGQQWRQLAAQTERSSSRFKKVFRVFGHKR